MAGKPAAPQARGDRVNFIINRMSRCSAIELPRLVRADHPQSWRLGNWRDGAERV